MESAKMLAGMRAIRDGEVNYEKFKVQHGQKKVEGAIRKTQSEITFTHSGQVYETHRPTLTINKNLWQVILDLAARQGLTSVSEYISPSDAKHFADMLRTSLRTLPHAFQVNHEARADLSAVIEFFGGGGVMLSEKRW